MELEEMKQLWQQQDKLLQKNKMLSEQIILNMLHDKSGNAISRMMAYEYAGAILCGLLAVLYLINFNTAFDSTPMLVCYLLSFIWFAITLVLFFFKYKMLKSMDAATNSIAETAHTTERFRLFIIKERMWSLMLSPIIILTLLVVFAQWIRHENIFNYLDVYLPRIIIGSLAAIIGIAIIYSKLYMGGIKKIQANLEEIEKFKASE